MLYSYLAGAAVKRIIFKEIWYKIPFVFRKEAIFYKKAININRLVIKSQPTFIVL